MEKLLSFLMMSLLEDLFYYELPSLFPSLSLIAAPDIL
jgi:hypothetical protein